MPDRKLLLLAFKRDPANFGLLCESLKVLVAANAKQEKPIRNDYEKAA